MLPSPPCSPEFSPLLFECMVGINNEQRLSTETMYRQRSGGPHAFILLALHTHAGLLPLCSAVTKYRPGLHRKTFPGTRTMRHSRTVSHVTACSLSPWLLHTTLCDDSQALHCPRAVACVLPWKGNLRSALLPKHSRAGEASLPKFQYGFKKINKQTFWK